jgi:hypothetical protein
MKSLTRTIIVLVIFNLVTGNFILAQNVPNERTAEPVEPAGRRRTPALAPELQPVPVPEPLPMDPEPESAPTPMPAPSRSGLFTISGRTGVSGVMMTGLPGNPVTDQKGHYSATVPLNWTSVVSPKKEGFTFMPRQKIYQRIRNDQPNQNYTAEIITFIISGTTDVSGVVMTGLPGRPVTTDKNGYYSATVEYGWSGTVKPKKDGFVFEPPELRYSRVMKDLTNNDYSPRRIGPAPMFARTGSREVLVIPATDIKAVDLAVITEDLQVMSHIFDERFKEPQEIQGVFVDFGDFFGRDSRSTEAIYIQDYGVLFLMEVNFAFSPEPKTAEKQDEETEDIDPIWQRTRQKMFSPPGFIDSEFEPEKKYSADKIDQLKTELVRTLKHTANIRNIEPDEWIILTVIGKARQPGRMYEYRYFGSGSPRAGRSSASRSRGRSSSSSRGSYSMGGSMYGGGMGMGGMYGGSGMRGMTGGSMGGGGFGGGMMMGGGMMGGMDSMYGEDYIETGSRPATVLTIRVKKSDVDAFARGFRKFEEFQTTVEIFTY